MYFKSVVLHLATKTTVNSPQLLKLNTFHQQTMMSTKKLKTMLRKIMKLKKRKLKMSLKKQKNLQL